MTKSEVLFEKARERIPGGVNSPVRAFKSVNRDPLFIERGDGAYVFDVDGNRYIDYVGSWGPLILGHAHPAVVAAITRTAQTGTSFGAPTESEVTIAELIADRVPNVDSVRLVNSGTEATMSAVRLARGYKKRDKIIKFGGCYHGHADCFLISAGSGALTLGHPSSPGVPESVAGDTLVARYNDLNSVRSVFDQHPDSVAAVIVEPVGGNAGCIPPLDGFLAGLRQLTSRYGALLIFDEVMTGFRVARGGAAERYHVVPDLYTFGKVIGGGLPIGAYAGPKESMQLIAPLGPVYQAGTLSGNPLAVAAGLATLEQLTPSAYQTLEQSGARLERGVQNLVAENGWPLRFQRVGSMFSLFFRKERVTCSDDASDSDMERFVAFFHGMLGRGIYLAPSPFEAGFLSLSHSTELVDETLGAMESVLRNIY